MKKITINKGTALDWFEVLTSLDVTATFKFNYAIKRNIDKLKSIIKTKPMYNPPTDETYLSFMDKIKEIAQKEKVNFRSIEEQNQYIEKILEKEDEETKILIKKVRDTSIFDYTNSFTVWQKEEVEIDLYTINVDDFPDGLTTTQFQFLMDYFLRVEGEQ